MAPMLVLKLLVLVVCVSASFSAATGSQSCSTKEEQPGRRTVQSLLQTAAGGTGATASDKDSASKKQEPAAPADAPAADSATDSIMPLTKRLTGLEEQVVALEHKGENKAAGLQSEVDALNSRLAALEAAVNGKQSAATVAMVQDSLMRQPLALSQQSQPATSHAEPLTALSTDRKRQDPAPAAAEGEASPEGAVTEPITTRLTALEARVTSLESKGDTMLTQLKTEVDTIRSKLETLTTTVMGGSMVQDAMIQTSQEDAGRQDPAPAGAAGTPLTQRIAILEMKVVSLGHRGDNRRTNLQTEVDALETKLSNLEKIVMGSK